MEGWAPSSFTQILTLLAITAGLVAIGVPQYLRYRLEQRQFALETALRNAMTAVETYFLKNDRSYAGLDWADLERNGYRPFDGVVVVIDRVTARRYVLRAWAVDGGGETLVYDSALGDVTRTRPSGYLLHSTLSRLGNAGR